MFSCLKCRPWDWTAIQKQITFDELAHQHTKALLALYHFQPIPSYDDLQDIDPFIECLTTVSSAALNREREVMRMTMAVSILEMPHCTRLLTCLVPLDWHLQDVRRQRFSMAALGEEDQERKYRASLMMLRHFRSWSSSPRARHGKSLTPNILQMPI